PPGERLLGVRRLLPQGEERAAGLYAPVVADGPTQRRPRADLHLRPEPVDVHQERRPGAGSGGPVRSREHVPADPDRVDRRLGAVLIVGEPVTVITLE